MMPDYPQLPKADLKPFRVSEQSGPAVVGWDTLVNRGIGWKRKRGVRLGLSVICGARMQPGLRVATV
jgi:hypothetical protein